MEEASRAAISCGPCGRINQVKLNLGTGATGETRSAAAQETEARAARTDVKSRAAVGLSMEAIVERDNLRKALARVKANKGAAGKRSPSEAPRSGTLLGGHRRAASPSDYL